MGVSINVMTAKILKSDSGEFIGLKYPMYYDNGGNCFMKFISDIGYGDDQYGKHIILTEDQVDLLIRFLGKNCIYDYDGMLSGINRARMNGESVFFEADW